MKSKLTILIFSILLLSSISALDYTIQLNDEDVSNAVIFNTYKIYLNDVTGDLTNNYQDQLTLLNDYGTIKIYEWKTNQVAGKRTFQIGADSFQVNTISEVDEMLNKITNFKIFVGEDNSYIETNFDLFDTTQEMQFIEYNDYSANINFANLLKGINAKIELNKEDYPIIDYLVINSSTAITMIEALLIEEGFSFTVDDINSNPQYYINYLMDYYGYTYDYDENVKVEKNNNFYRIDSNKGYSEISGNTREQVESFIEDNLEYFTPLDIVDSIFRFTDYDLSEYVDLDFDYELAIDFNNLEMEDGIYTLTFLYTDSHGNTGEKNFNVILDITEQVVIEPEPDCSNGQTTCEGTNYFICQNQEWVNQGKVNGFCGYEFVCSSGQTNCDGDYYFVCANNNWINYGKLDGYCGYEEPIDEPEVNETETEVYIPSNTSILEYVNKVEGLKNGTIIQIEVKEEITGVPILSNSNNLGYLNITTNQNTTAYLYFHILKSKVTDKNKVSLYVLESSWVKLNTTYLEENSLYYEYKAEVPHFSIFMFAEDTYVAPTPSTYNPSSSRCNYNKNYDWGCSEWSICINGIQIRTCKERNNCGNFYGKPEESRSCVVGNPSTVPIEISDSEKEQGFFARITGATIEAIGPIGISFVLIFFVLGIIGAFILIRIERKKRQKVEETNKNLTESQEESKVEETEKKKKVKSKKKKTPKKKKKSKNKNKLKEEAKEKIDINTEPIMLKEKNQAKEKLTNKKTSKAKSKGKKKSKKKSQAESKSS
ncbi:MAG: PGF-pre-PGF domain-containing protein [Nanoarchaeota archaeon]|nr:PGF-pre-PGF domain-containing protein [Nanoarchaeota archaeon]